MHYLPFGAAIGDRLLKHLEKEDEEHRLSARGFVVVISYWRGGGKMGHEAPFWSYSFQKGDFPAGGLLEVEGRTFYIAPSEQQLLSGCLIEFRQNQPLDIHPL